MIKCINYMFSGQSRPLVGYVQPNNRATISLVDNDGEMRVDIPMRLLEKAMQKCKEINATGDMDYCFNVEVVEWVGERDARLRKIRFVQTVDGWVMRVCEK